MIALGLRGMKSRSMRTGDAMSPISAATSTASPTTSKRSASHRRPVPRRREAPRQIRDEARASVEEQGDRGRDRAQLPAFPLTPPSVETQESADAFDRRGSPWVRMPTPRRQASVWCSEVEPVGRFEPRAVERTVSSESRRGRRGRKGQSTLPGATAPRALGRRLTSAPARAAGRCGLLSRQR